MSSVQSPQGKQLACDILVHSGHVLTGDGSGRIFDFGAVAIRSGRIVDVGGSQELCLRYRASTTVDARGGVVHPGFIDAHIHISQYTSRSVLSRMSGRSVGMGDWKAALRPEDEAASARLAAVDYLRCGYTGFVDPGTIFEPDAVADVADQIGIRIWMTDPYVADQVEVLAADEPDLVSAGFLARWPKSTRQALDRLGSQLHRNGEEDGLVRGFIGLYGAGTASDELTAAARTLARDNGVQFQEHRGYNPRVYLAEEARHGVSTIRRLAEADMLGSATTFVHMNVVHADDVSLLAETRTGLVWCPYAQMRAMGGGLAEPRMPELARAGASVALATDIPRTVTFDALGMLAVANAAACGSALSSRDVFRMRTLGAAQSIGAAAELGSIETGKRADIVIRAPASSEQLGVDRVAETVLLSPSSAPAMTLVGGRIVQENGIVKGMDQAEILERARQSTIWLLNRIGLGI